MSSISFGFAPKANHETFHSKNSDSVFSSSWLKSKSVAKALVICFASVSGEVKNLKITFFKYLRVTSLTGCESVTLLLTWSHPTEFGEGEIEGEDDPCSGGGGPATMPFDFISFWSIFFISLARNCKCRTAWFFSSRESSKSSTVALRWRTSSDVSTSPGIDFSRSSFSFNALVNLVLSNWHSCLSVTMSSFSFSFSSCSLRFFSWRISTDLTDSVEVSFKTLIWFVSSLQSFCNAVFSRSATCSWSCRSWTKDWPFSTSTLRSSLDRWQSLISIRRLCKMAFILSISDSKAEIFNSLVRNSSRVSSLVAFILLSSSFFVLMSLSRTFNVTFNVSIVASRAQILRSLFCIAWLLALSPSCLAISISNSDACIVSLSVVIFDIVFSRYVCLSCRSSRWRQSWTNCSALMMESSALLSVWKSVWTHVAFLSFSLANAVSAVKSMCLTFPSSWFWKPSNWSNWSLHSPYLLSAVCEACCNDSLLSKASFRRSSSSLIRNFLLSKSVTNMVKFPVIMIILYRKHTQLSNVYSVVVTEPLLQLVIFCFQRIDIFTTTVFIF